MTAPSGGEPPPLRRRVPELDGLRGVAILLVLAMHYFVQTVQVPDRTGLSYLGAILTLAWSGVDLFFVLSGFLIGGILVDERESPRYFSAFYGRRFFRIIPVYAAVCAVFLIGLATALPERVPGLQTLYLHPIPWPFLATFTQNYWLPAQRATSPFLGVTWSLAIEEQFYLTLPLVVRFLQPARLPYVLATTVILAPVLRLFLLKSHPDLWMAPYMYMPCRADALALGALGALAMRHAGAVAWLQRHLGLLYAAAGVLLVPMAHLTLTRATNHEHATAFLGYTAIAAFYLVVLLIAVNHPRSPVAGVARMWPLRRLGILAYGVYLFHLPILYACFGIMQGSAPRFGSDADAACTALALVLTLVAAHLSWELFEKRLVARGSRFTYSGAAPR
jgi:peptidoglycan/LPS O-acetylase OafA/YrhL